MDLDTLPTVAPPWHCQSIVTIKIGVYDVIGELFVIDCWDLSQVGHICWHHSGDLYAFGHVMCNMPVTFVGVSSCCCSYMVVISTNFCIYWHLLWPNGRCCEVADCLGSDGTMRNNVVQLGVLICRTAVLWWTHWSAILAVKFHIPWSHALLWLYMDSIQKHVLMVYNQILRLNMHNKEYKSFCIFRSILLITKKHDSAS